jgi:hypothetical protein
MDKPSEDMEIYRIQWMAATKIKRFHYSEIVFLLNVGLYKKILLSTKDNKSLNV